MLILVGSNLYALHRINREFTTAAYMGQDRTAFPILYSVHRLFTETEDRRASVVAELRNLILRNESRFDYLLNGDPARAIEPESDPARLASIKELKQVWRTRIVPLLERVIAADTLESVRGEIRALDDDMRAFGDATDQRIAQRQAIANATVERHQDLQALFVVLVLVALAGVLLIAFGVSRRASALARTAARISAGELDLTAPAEGRDELGVLGQSFNAMTASLRRIIETERDGQDKLKAALAAVAETSNSLFSASAEILAATNQQAAGMSQQTTAVNETVTTVDEVLQTSDQAAQRAKYVADASRRAADVGVAGRKAVDQTTSMMNGARERTESLAESILNLAEHAQAIGEIIAAVNDMAEQTNLLALNAGIEAARAGEHGRGFSVVAAEIKALADQSKKSTSQVRQILGDIQKATNSAVMAAEEGTRSVTSALQAANEAGSTIEELAHVIAEAAQSAQQIAASASQQVTGMNQIHQAMNQIGAAANQNLAATRQSEQAAKNLHELGSRLKELLAGHAQ
jgi:methyl-accepting chemotaxis protein